MYCDKINVESVLFSYSDLFINCHLNCINDFYMFQTHIMLYWHLVVGYLYGSSMQKKLPFKIKKKEFTTNRHMYEN